MSWTPEKVEKLKELWGKGNTASEIAQILGGVTRNAVIGKAHRLNLSGKIQTKKSSSLATSNNVSENKISRKNLRRGKFKSLIIDKDFEPENPKQLEELDEISCKCPVGHPNEDNYYFLEKNSTIGIEIICLIETLKLFFFYIKLKELSVTEKLIII